MRRPLPVGLSPRSGRSFAPGRHFPVALHSPSALSRLAKGRTRAALRRRRSAGQRPAAARSARLGAGRRIPRRAAGGSLGRHSHAAFCPQGSPACGQQRALAGALSAIREQAPSLSLPPRHRTQVKLGRRHGRGEAVPFHSDQKRKKTDNPREGWEDEVMQNKSEKYSRAYRRCPKVSVAELREAMGAPLNAHSATASLARAAPTGGRCARPASSRCTTRPQTRVRTPLVASGSRWLDDQHPLGRLLGPAAAVAAVGLRDSRRPPTRGSWAAMDAEGVAT